MDKLTNLKDLRLKANDVRQSIIQSLHEAGSGHTAGPLGMADIFTALYFNVADIDPKNPEEEARDRIVLSNGHICPVLYASLAHRGYFEVEELMTLRKLGSRLQGHPHRGTLPGIENTSGPLGSGTSQAAGMALALKMNGSKQHVWCLVSDGEQQEGNTWEGVMFAAANKLDNLTVIMDRNYIQIDGNTEDIMPLDPLDKKYESFNWNVIKVDGHNIEQVIDAMEQSKSSHGKPTMIIADVVPGKGVGFMENDYTWHGKPPKSQEEFDTSMADLAAARKEIEADQMT